MPVAPVEPAAAQQRPLQEGLREPDGIGRLAPRPSQDAIAAESTQPVPCVFIVAMRAFSYHVGLPPGRARQSRQNLP